MNERQKAFCRNVSAGQNQTKAYENAGYEASHDQARRKASALMARDDVQEELARLRQPKEEATYKNREERMVALSRMADAAEAAGDIRAAVACIAELNKMDGVYKDSPSVNVQVGLQGMQFSDLMKEIETGAETPTPAAS